MKPNDKKLLRALIIRSLREFFHSQNFVETDTPSLVFSPGMEPHIRPLQIQHSAAFLHTSPEFAMKRILAQGYPAIFQIAKVYRFEPVSQTHHPEFSMLEWYRSQSSYFDIMNDVENLFNFLCQKIYQSDFFNSKNYGPQNCAKPFLRMTIDQCFEKFVGQSLKKLSNTSAMLQQVQKLNLLSGDASQYSWDDLFFLIMLNCIEPELKKLQRPVIVYDYPKSQAALANLKADSDGFEWAQRFEVYAGGLELANAFDELCDAKLQRKRFEHDQIVRAKIYKNQYPESPIDDDFLNALNTMPKSAGIALGVDRLVMYFSDAKNIAEVVWQQPYLENERN